MPKPVNSTRTRAVGAADLKQIRLAWVDYVESNGRLPKRVPETEWSAQVAAAREELRLAKIADERAFRASREVKVPGPGATRKDFEAWWKVTAERDSASGDCAARVEHVKRFLVKLIERGPLKGK